MSITIVAISDTHALHDQLRVPEGDILIHAGDLTNHGELEDVRAFDAWLGTLPHRHKVVIAGNHDFCFERELKDARSLITRATYLQDEATEVLGVRIYGSPWQPWFFDWAFNLPRGPELARVWAAIPDDTDILVTHGPPRGHGDRNIQGEPVGCDDLLQRIREVQPRYHIFGHIHEAYGVTQEGPTTCVNASICNLTYEPVQAPIVLTLEG